MCWYEPRVVRCAVAVVAFCAVVTFYLGKQLLQLAGHLDYSLSLSFADAKSVAARLLHGSGEKDNLLKLLWRTGSPRFHCFCLLVAYCWVPPDSRDSGCTD